MPLPTFEGHANKWYMAALDRIMSEGDRVTTRGRTTWEILHAVTLLPNPCLRVLTVPYRKANPFFQALETVWILAGRADAAWLTYYNSQMANFLDDYEIGPGWASGEIRKNEYFHGAYGERLIRWGEHRKTHGGCGPDLHPRNQIKDVIVQLTAEASSRRAVMAIHNPAFDNPDTQTLDRPCNLTMSYQLRHGHLYAATFNRSNDLNLGLAFTNICQFTTIQEFIAAALSVNVGGYTHFSSSLHVYQDDPIVQRLISLRPSHFDCGPSLAKEILRHQDAMDFDVYNYVEARPMMKWTDPELGWKIITTLEELGTYRGDPTWQQEKAVEAIECPYWRSVGFMALAWHVLKNEDRMPGMAMMDALGYLGRMDALDWQVVCLEYLHRWSDNRGIGPTYRNIVGSREFVGRLHQDVQRFIFHDVAPTKAVTVGQ